MFQTEDLVYDTRREQTECLGGIQLLKVTANENVKKIGRFIVETTFEIWSPKD